MYKLRAREPAELRDDGSKAYWCTLMSSETPSADTLNLTGADVDGLEDTDIIAFGSVLITPEANYIAFTDGIFTKKE